MEALPRLVSDSFVVAVLTFTISISLAKLAAKLHSYDIDYDQEFVAYGLSNLLSSFFSCFACCNAPPRVMILSNVGAKSTFNAIYCTVFIVIILLAAGQLFVTLPVAVLAAMICVAMKNLLLQTTQLPFIWRTSKPDFIIWVITCLVSILIDLDIGIIVGIGVSIFTIIVKSQTVSGMVGAVSSTEDLIHLNGNRMGVKSSNQFEIFHFPSQLYFANAEKFKDELFSKVLHPATLQHRGDNNGELAGVEELTGTKSTIELRQIKHIVLECSAMTYMDIAGAAMMKTVADLYNKSGVILLLANCPQYSLTLLDKMGYFQTRSRDTVYNDVYDAVNSIQDTQTF